MFLALFCVLWLLLLYEGNWLLATAVVIWLGFAFFVDYATRFRITFPQEDEDAFYDALSTNSLFFFEAASEITSGISGYETGTEDSQPAAVYKDAECFMYKPKVKYPEDLMENFLDNCLDESGFIKFENIRWIIGPLAHPETSEQQPQSTENDVQSQLNEDVEQPQETESVAEAQGNENGEQPGKSKGNFKKRLKKLFCCCCCCGCGKKN